MSTTVPITSRWNETGTSTVTITAPAAGKLALTALEVKVDASRTITIASPLGTTIWVMTTPAAGIWEKSWGDENPLLGANEQAIVITVSGGTYQINCAGFTVG